MNLVKNAAERKQILHVQTICQFTPIVTDLR